MYFTGTVNSNSDMLTAINNACVAAGWTLTSGVLTSGDVAVKLEVQTGRLMAQIGTGRSGSALVNPCVPKFGLGFSTGTGSAGAIVYPATYHIFAFEDEVYVALNYRLDYYEWLCFGRAKDVPAGEGQFMSGAITDQYAYNANENRLATVSATTTGIPGSTRGTDYQTTATTYTNQYYRPILLYSSNVVIRSSLRGSAEWLSSKNGTTAALVNQVFAHTILGDIFLVYSPGDNFYTAALCPLSFILPNPGGVNGAKIFGRLDKIRLMRNDFVTPGDVVTFGSESWQCFPAIRRVPGGTVNEKLSYAVRV